MKGKLVLSKYYSSSIRLISEKYYYFDLQFYEEISNHETKIDTKFRYISIMLKKMHKGRHWPRLLKNTQKCNWLKTDRDLYVPEDKEEDLELNLAMGKDELPDEPNSDDDFENDIFINSLKKDSK